ncbi:MAG: alcohol dehydrogenase catalytic domain-containing protein [Thermosphaera sp.]
MECVAQDTEIIDGKAPPPKPLPHALAHEIASIIEKVGEGIKSLGDVVKGVVLLRL